MIRFGVSHFHGAGCAQPSFPFVPSSGADISSSPCSLTTYSPKPHGRILKEPTVETMCALSWIGGLFRGESLFSCQGNSYTKPDRITHEILAEIVGIAADAIICMNDFQRITFFNKGAE